MTSPVTPDEPESARSEDREAAPRTGWPTYALSFDGSDEWHEHHVGPNLRPLVHHHVMYRQHGHETGHAFVVEPSSDLSTAWEAAEAALPEGWTLELGLWSAEPNRPAGMPPYEATAAPYVHDPHESGCVGRGETAAAAVEQLTSALQARSTEQGGAG